MPTPPPGRRGSQNGITLVEILIVMSILGILTTMMVAGWLSMQRSYAFASHANTARATVRDALDRMSSELRATQPLTSTGYPIQTANPYECVFYSSYNQPGTRADGTGNSASVLRPTRIVLVGTGDQKQLYWQRDTDGAAGFTAFTDPYPVDGDRRILLAEDVVNGASTVSIPYVFKYGYLGASGELVTWPTDTPMADPSKIISVQIRLVVDANLGHSPQFIDMSTTVRPRNSAAGFLEEE